MMKHGFKLIIGLLLSTQSWAAKPVETVPGEYLVKMREGFTSFDTQNQFAALGIEVKHVYDSQDIVHIKIPASVSESEFKANMMDSGTVEYVARNIIFRKFQTPNDPKLSKQYAHDKIQSREAWDLATGSKDIVVAVIDTGVNYNHPDIAPNYWTNPGESGLDGQGRDKRTNRVDDDGNGYVDDWRGWDFINKDNDPMDDDGHGTHCAGNIGAKGNNGIGIAGVNWNVSIVGLKFIGANGSGTFDDALKAIEYATKMGFPITSNSWGGTGDAEETRLMTEVIAKAQAAGQLFVAAAGNEMNNNDRSPTLPAAIALDNVMTIAASNTLDRMAYFSNYGKESVDFAAPGTAIYSTIDDDSYTSMDGTSMACPIAAGAAALVKSHFPNMSMIDVKNRLMATVDQKSAFRNKVKSGGRLNVYRALSEAVAP